MELFWNSLWRKATRFRDSALVAVGRDGSANSSLESRNDQKHAIGRPLNGLKSQIILLNTGKKNTNTTSFLFFFLDFRFMVFIGFSTTIRMLLLLFSLSLGALIVWGVISGSSSTGNSSSRYKAMSMYQRQQQLNEVRKMNDNMSEMNDMSDFM